MIYAVEMASCGMHVYIPSFMKIGTGVDAILRFCLDARDLWIIPLIGDQMS
jgi:hypothetical protein